MWLTTSRSLPGTDLCCAPSVPRRSHGPRTSTPPPPRSCSGPPRRCGTAKRGADELILRAPPYRPSRGCATASRHWRCGRWRRGCARLQPRACRPLMRNSNNVYGSFIEAAASGLTQAQQLLYALGALAKMPADSAEGREGGGGGGGGGGGNEAPALAAMLCGAAADAAPHSARTQARHRAPSFSRRALSLSGAHSDREQARHRRVGACPPRGAPAGALSFWASANLGEPRRTSANRC